jgi:hypothetical protein
MKGRKTHTLFVSLETANPNHCIQSLGPLERANLNHWTQWLGPLERANLNHWLGPLERANLNHWRQWLGPVGRANLNHKPQLQSPQLRTKTDEVSKTLCSSVFSGIPDDGQTPKTKYSWVSHIIVRTLYSLLKIAVYFANQREHINTLCETYWTVSGLKQAVQIVTILL